ncbi:aminodeoxychorismate/anthranilate synthase component II [Blochmannia endosymbiont of Camponotus sp. C-003]|uniref:anthranilate synthase component II n=1 Tax=unclassified Candidatus Blochmanniella TaxID=711328 RepID=UPI0020249215|nr:MULTISPECIES: aminodeoxychorismate/anthranilate synthase component II [unclassified Candidatus Blochmannia]URJ23280.1 aminodeoxychorismate/anthranilate synthase component II [Blochmannia endosymbiont of Camponotus sp. C-003]URJ28751.1 aminodeoxychorismate/anthranilate synthase component II [Blochmannia endosymbiont of Camponotus sp. C-046]
MNKILIIDNYDSFTWNLYQYFREMGGIVEVRRNDSLNTTDIDQLSPERLVISPGPGTPDNAGVSLDAIYYFHKKIPILGVCLGHQAIAQFFGAKLKYAQKVMHGKISLIHHNGNGIFNEVTQPLNVVRYHSLVIDPNTMPSCLEITAWNKVDDKCIEIMGIRHCNLFVEGVQFHPESILSEQGYQILNNFMKY